MEESSKKQYKYARGIDAAIAVTGGKWKPLILYELRD
jgi:DNA-binding HxlR family transcriptional regulator